MALVQRYNRPWYHRNRAVVDEPVAADETAVAPDHGVNVISRVIWTIAGIILLLLAFRFVLALLGANPANAFANFIYSASRPFVAPFFNLFNYSNIQYGAARFEVYTLVAMAVYAAIAWVLSAIANIGRRY